MKNPVWVNDDTVELIHKRQLAEHGGQDGLRDRGMLESALSRPKQLSTYGDPPPDLCDLAAAYAFGIARNHPFLDGNKRTAVVICELFLELNNRIVMASEESKYPEYLRLAVGEHSEATFAEWLRTVSRPLDN